MASIKIKSVSGSVNYKEIRKGSIWRYSSLSNHKLAQYQSRQNARHWIRNKFHFVPPHHFSKSPHCFSFVFYEPPPGHSLILPTAQVRMSSIIIYVDAILFVAGMAWEVLLHYTARRNVDMWRTRRAAGKVLRGGEGICAVTTQKFAYRWQQVGVVSREIRRH